MILCIYFGSNLNIERVDATGAQFYFSTIRYIHFQLSQSLLHSRKHEKCRTADDAGCS